MNQTLLLNWYLTRSKRVFSSMLLETCLQQSLLKNTPNKSDFFWRWSADLFVLFASQEKANTNKYSRSLKWLKPQQISVTVKWNQQSYRHDSHGSTWSGAPQKWDLVSNFFVFVHQKSCFLSSDLHNWDECPGGCAPIRHPPPPLWPPGRWCYAPTLRSHWYPFLCWRHYAAQTGGGGGVTEENRVLNTIYGILIWFWLFQAWIVDKKWKKKNHTDLSDSLQEKRNALITEKDHGGHMWRK